MPAEHLSRRVAEKSFRGGAERSHLTEFPDDNYRVRNCSSDRAIFFASIHTARNPVRPDGSLLLLFLGVLSV